MREKERRKKRKGVLSFCCVFFFPVYVVLQKIAGLFFPLRDCIMVLF